jgi:hypothetical protein
MMLRLRRKSAILAAMVGMLALASCDRPSADAPPTSPPLPSPLARESLGLMSSLPLYWPQGADLAGLAAGRGEPAWQRMVIEQAYALVPLDTLSPTAALSPGTPETDPLAGLSRLAVIQPRGLSPADNVALDDWVRRGGRLLLVLDPALTGDYDLPLGDPRRPVDSALIPPVVARWGMAVRVDETQPATVITAPLAEADLPMALPGRIAITDPAAGECALAAGGAAATCRVGEGRVTLIADAALFEHPDLAGEGGAGLLAVITAALE